MFCRQHGELFSPQQGGAGGGVLGVWEVVVEEGSGLVTDIWLLRQLTQQEEQKLVSACMHALPQTDACTHPEE